MNRSLLAVLDLEGSEMSMEGEGVFSADSTRGVMTATMELDGEQIKFEGIALDGVMYLKSDQIPLPEGKEWFKTPDPPTSTLSPSEFVSFLRDSEGVENAGTEEIRGEETTHFRGPLDFEKLAEESGSELIKRLRANPQVEQMDITVDLWVEWHLCSLTGNQPITRQAARPISPLPYPAQLTFAGAPVPGAIDDYAARASGAGSSSANAASARATSSYAPRLTAMPQCDASISTSSSAAPSRHARQSTIPSERE